MTGAIADRGETKIVLCPQNSQPRANEAAHGLAISSDGARHSGRYDRRAIASSSSPVQAAHSSTWYTSATPGIVSMRCPFARKTAMALSIGLLDIQTGCRLTTNPSTGGWHPPTRRHASERSGRCMAILRQAAAFGLDGRPRCSATLSGRYDSACRIDALRDDDREGHRADEVVPDARSATHGFRRPDVVLLRDAFAPSDRTER